LDLQMPAAADGIQPCTLRAAIDASGRSLRPEQVQQWIGERLGQSLALTALRREALLLKPVLICT
jgi:hypothetical protein